VSHDDPPAVVLFERRDDPDLVALATALGRELGEPDEERESVEPGGSFIALPVLDEAGPVARLDRARVAVALDAASVRRAREAGVPRVVALLPRLSVEGELDADLVIVAHEGLIEDVVGRGVPPSRVRNLGPVAPDGWAPASDRDALRTSLALRTDVPWIVVRASSFEADPAATLVQLSLVRVDPVWLFDVGGDPELARTLRQRVPGYGLDAVMFADGAEALRAYQAADAVLGRIEGPEVIRALAVGAAVVTLPPRGDQVRLAHVLETSGVAEVADAAATLAVSLDRVLEPEHLAEARAAVGGLAAPEGVRRVAGVVRQLARGELPIGGAGLPVGLERLSELEASRPARPERPEPGPSRPGRDDVDAKVDEELAALRRRLGL
jgi:hypothetical protein